MACCAPSCGGSRSRSRSPGYRRLKLGKDRRRSRSRDKDRRTKDRHRSRSRSPAIRHRRSRSRSPRRRRSRSRSTHSRDRSRSRERREKETKSSSLLVKPPVTEADLEGKTDEEIEMIKLMGFGDFDTTKGKHVQGNDSSAVNIIHKRKYRQYMNRKGGFNRPLDFVA